MIESKVGKYSIVVAMLVLAALILARATERKRAVPYAIAGVLVVWATYVGIRARPWTPPPPSSILGDVDEFLQQVPAQAASFSRWAATHGLTRLLPPQALEEWIWDHREAIGEDWHAMVKPTVAAYGESLRAARPELAWAKRGGDAVLEVPGWPWTRRRVAVEVHDNVFSDV